MSKKVQSNIVPNEPGMYIEDGNTTIVAFADRDWNTGSVNYYLNFYQGLMPTFGGETFKTREGLEAAMRKIQPDMRYRRTKFEE